MSTGEAPRLHCFCINLDDRPDKWADLQAAFQDTVFDTRKAGKGVEPHTRLWPQRQPGAASPGFLCSKTIVFPRMILLRDGPVYAKSCGLLVKSGISFLVALHTCKDRRVV